MQDKIIYQLIRILKSFELQPHFLATLNSYKDTFTDKEFLEMLEDYKNIDNLCYMGHTIKDTILGCVYNCPDCLERRKEL